MPRKSKPKSVKIAEGTYRADRAPEPKRVNQRKPVNPFAKGTFAYEMHAFTCKRLQEIGAIGLADRSHIEALAQAYQVMKTAYQQMESEGFTTMDDRGRQQPHPAFRVWSSAADKVRSLGNDLGCNYSSRCKLASAEPPPESSKEARKASYFG